MSRIIVALSGGKASAMCAKWALDTYDKKDVTLYFNDTKWEHPDLYRFMDDLSKYFDHPITEDTDGRSPEQLFEHNRALANDRMPFCSRVLKAERLQKYCKDRDTLVFGIGMDEMHRASRLIAVYQRLSMKRDIRLKIKLPLITEKITSEQIDEFLKSAGIEEPELYKLGFLHNNCSGGCVRAGKKQWKMLYEKLPEVYMERERVEIKIRKQLGKDVHFFKNETLTAFRGRIERGELSAYYNTKETKVEECVGICDSVN